MRFTLTKDMIAAALLAEAGLMFHLGAVFGPDPPESFLKVYAAVARPLTPSPEVTGEPVASPVTVASFLDQPAAIAGVTIDARDGRTRIDLRLGAGAVDPRFSRVEGSGGALLVIRGLDASAGMSGPGGGLVRHWMIDSAEGAVFAVKRPVLVARVALDDVDRADRHLLIDLSEACSPPQMQGGDGRISPSRRQNAAASDNPGIAAQPT